MSTSKKYPTPKLWRPKNLKKYKGNYNNIWVRSSYELRVYKWLDNNESVLEWSSEEHIVMYKSPIDGKYHRYFLDAYAKIKSADGRIVEYLIEIKPYQQTIEPKIKKNITKSYINEVYTWGINSAKWNAAKQHCKQRGWVFKIITEKEIFGKTE